MSIHQWTSNYDIFISIYYEKCAHVIVSLIKYGFNMRTMSKQFGFPVAKEYDENFRKVRKILNVDWAVLNDDLWRIAFYDQYKPKQNASHNNVGKFNKQVGSVPFQRRVQQSSPFPQCFAGPSVE